MMFTHQELDELRYAVMDSHQLTEELLANEEDEWASPGYEDLVHEQLERLDSLHTKIEGLMGMGPTGHESEYCTCLGCSIKRTELEED